MTLIDTIKQNFITAYKNGDSIKKDCLGVIKTKAVLIEKEKGEVTDSDILQIINKEVKNIDSTLEFAEKGTDIYNKAIAEKEIYSQYLPDQLDEEIVIGEILSVINDNNFTKKDFGKLMGMSAKKYALNFDKSKLKDIIQNLLK